MYVRHLHSFYLPVVACATSRRSLAATTKKAKLRGAKLSAPVDALLSTGHKHIAGVDEAGAGPLAGPVVAAAVMLNTAVKIPDLPFLNDSKLMSESRRKEVYNILIEHEAFKVGVARMDAGEVDRINILQARMEAMKMAVAKLGKDVEVLFVDGDRRVDGLEGMEQKCVIGGDGKISVVAMASVVAKVTRDEIMKEMDVKWPQYGFAKHKGYSTQQHMESLMQFGPCPIHRRSYKPVKRAEEEMEKRRKAHDCDAQ